MLKIDQSSTVYTPGTPYQAPGKITIGSFEEHFNIILNYWTLDDYLAQWSEGIKRITTSSESCLVTTVQDPRRSIPHIEMWTLYKIDACIYVRNQLFFGPIYKKIIGTTVFSPSSCYHFIQPRKIVPKSQNQPQEWCVPFDVHALLASPAPPPYQRPFKEPLLYNEQAIQEKVYTREDGAQMFFDINEGAFWKVFRDTERIGSFDKHLEHKVGL